MNSAARAVTALGTTGLGALLYGTLIERNAYVLRSFDVPVLAAGAEPVRVLHISDLHLTAGQHRKQRWVRDLARLRPDLVINTGDTNSDPNGIPGVMHALEPLFEFPGVFVPGNNDYWAPEFRSPIRYFRPGREVAPGQTPMPWPELAAAMSRAGWTDLTHARTVLAAGTAKVALAGTDDPHLQRAHYELVAGPAEPDATVRIGVTHSPEPGMLAAFAGDGYDLVLAGHTHGGQVRIPFGPPLVTNCGIEHNRARWLHQWDERMYFHISAGLGTNPTSAIRFCCRPEATLLTLVPRS